jgi:hypothetical protein
LKGPTQPIVNFPRKQSGDCRRAFQQSWYKRYNWVEYSVSKDAIFCFYCFLFKELGRKEYFGFDVFNKVGFNDWKHAYKYLLVHVDGKIELTTTVLNIMMILKIKGIVSQACS